MKYTVQMLDNDFNCVEYKVEANDVEQAQRKAFEGINKEDISMVAVFEEGSNISLPLTPVDQIDLTEPDEPEQTCFVSELQVMRSAAGWYVGHGYYDTEMGMTEADGFPLPWSRESDYFPTQESAQAYLDYMCQE